MSVFELELPAIALCPFFFESDIERHGFLVGTADCTKSNKICAIEFDDESNSISNLYSWKHDEEIINLSCSSAKKICLFSAVFRDHTVLYRVEGDNRKDICSSHIRCSQILWDAEEINSCVAISDHSLQSISIDADKLGLVTSHFQCDDENILCASLDPFHSGQSLVALRRSISLIDIRASKSVMEFSPIMHGLGDLTSLEYSPVTPGRFLTTGSDGTIRVHDIRMSTGDGLDSKAYFQAHDHAVHKALFNPFHDELVISCSSDQSLRLWELQSTGDGVPVQMLNEFHDSVLNLCWSMSGPWIFAGLSYNGKLVVESVQDEKKMNILLEEKL